MWKKVLLVLVVLVLVLAGVVASRPAEFRIERSAVVDAPPAVAFALVDDLGRFPEWSPWQKLDPQMKVERSGPPSGVGASHFWSGNDEVGEGRMTITKSTPPQLVEMRLEFLKPWTATNVSTWTFTASEGRTRVSWAMSGRNDFMGKAMSLVMDMDAMVGKDFERGLAQLRTLAEKEAKAAPSEPAPVPEAAASPAPPPAP